MLPPLPKLPLCSPHIRVTIKCVISCPFLSPLPVGQETEVSSGSEEPITLCNLRCMCWLLWSTEPFIGPTPANPGFLPLLKCFLFLSLAVLRSSHFFCTSTESHGKKNTRTHQHTPIFWSDLHWDMDEKDQTPTVYCENTADVFTCCLWSGQRIIVRCRLMVIVTVTWCQWVVTDMSGLASVCLSIGHFRASKFVSLHVRYHRT